MKIYTVLVTHRCSASGPLAETDVANFAKTHVRCDEVRVQHGDLSQSKPPTMPLATTKLNTIVIVEPAYCDGNAPFELEPDDEDASDVEVVLLLEPRLEFGLSGSFAAESISTGGPHSPVTHPRFLFFACVDEEGLRAARPSPTGRGKGAGEAEANEVNDGYQCLALLAIEDEDKPARSKAERARRIVRGCIVGRCCGLWLTWMCVRREV